MVRDKRESEQNQEEVVMMERREWEGRCVGRQRALRMRERRG